MKHISTHRTMGGVYLLLLFTSPLYTQNHFWEGKPAEELTMQQLLHPEQFYSFALDTTDLLTFLDDAPHEQEQDVRQSPIILTLPNPDQEPTDFRIVTYNMLEPDLQERWQHLSTWRGISTKDPSVTIRLDWTSRGFHAYVREGENTWFVDPYSWESKQFYMSYYRKDYPRPMEPFQCKTPAAFSPTPGIANAVNHLKTGDCQFRSYRLALACTGEYGVFHGGNEADVSSAMLTTMNRVNGIFEAELAIRLVLVANNNQLLFFNPATDPYSNTSSSAMLSQNQVTCNTFIGTSNYDIGHVFSTGNNGQATLRATCSHNKARGVTGQNQPFGDPFDVDYVAHEMGHQFGAQHTQNNDCNRSTAAVEPGSASTIMGYAGICAPNIQSNSDAYFHGISIQEIADYMELGAGDDCATIISTTNNAPIVGILNDYTIPKNTPFVLTSSSSNDADNDDLTYSWEQFDPEVGAVMPPWNTNTVGPLFRSFFPTNDAKRYFPRLSDLANGTDYTWEELPSVSRTMNFELTVRDFNGTYGCNTAVEQEINVDGTAGPFVVTSPTAGADWTAGATATVTWDVAGTTASPITCTSVDLLLSYDGGLTFPTVLLEDTPNDGTATVTIPVVSSTTTRIMVRSHDNIFFALSEGDFSITAGTSPEFFVGGGQEVLNYCQGSDDVLQYSLDFTATAGFASPISLTVENVPAGVSTQLSQTVVTPGQSVIVTVDNLGHLSAGDYSLLVKASSGGESINTTLRFTAVNSPAIATLNTPAVGDSDVYLMPTFQWLAAAYSDQYQLEIAEHPNFSSLVYTATTTETAYQLPIALDGDTEYFWRVRALNDGCTTGTPSRIRNFYTEACNYYGSQDTPLVISNGSPANHRSSIMVPDAGIITEMEVINVDITHSRTGDLYLRVIGPDFIPVTLLWYQCGDEDDIMMTFTDEGTPELVCPLDQGARVTPFGQLDDLVGSRMDGIWSLDVWDGFSGAGGQLNNWGIRFCANRAQALPVEWLSFDVTAQEKVIILDWATGQEDNHLGFDVERRADHETQFHSVGWVDASTEEHDVNHYSFVDESAQPGVTYYYRLRQLDYSGAEEYSVVRKATIKADGVHLQVFPNPSAGDIQVQLMGTEEATIVHLLDVQGRQLRKWEVTPKQVQTLPTSTLADGVYFLKIADGEGQQSQRLVIVR